MGLSHHKAINQTHEPRNDDSGGSAFFSGGGIHGGGGGEIRRVRDTAGGAVAGACRISRLAGHWLLTKQGGCAIIPSYLPSFIGSTMKLLSLFAVVFSFFAAGCTALSGGGLEGKFVNDMLPRDVIIYALGYDEKARKREIMIPGTENESRYSNIILYVWDAPVPCSDIKGVELLSAESKSFINMLLVNAEYGNKYIPSPGTGKRWTRPNLVAARGTVEEPKGDFTRQEALALAEHCGVEFQARQIPQQ